MSNISERQLRRLGLVDVGPDGKERARLGAQRRGGPPAQSIEELQSRLETWRLAVTDIVEASGGALVPGTLSTLGQATQVTLPLERIQAVQEHLRRIDTELFIDRPVDVIR